MYRSTYVYTYTYTYIYIYIYIYNNVDTSNDNNNNTNDTDNTPGLRAVHEGQASAVSGATVGFHNFIVYR